MISFTAEPIEQCWNDVIRLAAESWAEVETHEHEQGFDMRLDRYLDYERAGMLHCGIVRDDGVAVGYVIGYTSQSMHTQALVCTEDHLYLQPAYRKGWIAAKFIHFAEDFVRRLGAVEMKVTARIDGRIPKILEFLDFQPIAILYSKSLGGADSASLPHAVMESTSNEFAGSPEAS